MAKPLAQLRKEFTEIFEQFEGKMIAVPGLLGNGEGVVETAQPGIVLARIDNGVIQCYNTRMPNIEDTPVMIGYDPVAPRLLQVLDYDQATTTLLAEASPATLGAHAETHRWMSDIGSTDVLYVERHQIMGLRVTPAGTGDLQITISRGLAPTTSGTFTEIFQHNMDLSSYLPTTPEHYRWIVIATNPDGAIEPIIGLEAHISFFSVTTAPAIPIGYMALAGVRLNYGHIVLVETKSNTDFMDLRMISPTTTAFGAFQDLADQLDELEQTLSDHMSFG